MDERMNCLAAVQSLLPSLRGVEQRIAQYIVHNAQAVLTQPIAKLAAEIGTAESSIIRFCRRVGYSGFSAFKIGLAGSLSQAARYDLDDLTLPVEPMDAWQIMERVFAQTRLVLEQTQQILKREDFLEAAKQMGCAQGITFFGIGTSAPIAQDAYYRFLRLGMPVSYAVDPYEMLLTANNLRSGCVAVGISHTGRSKETIRALQLARDKGALTVCITSYLDAPITRCADIPLVTSTAANQVVHEAVASRIAHISLLDSLYIFLALQRFPDLSDAFYQINDLLRTARQ